MSDAKRRWLYSVLIPCIVGFLFLPGDATAQVPYGYHFIRTDQNPANVIYDPWNQQFFISVPAQNEIEVVSGTDGSVLAHISVVCPNAMDLSTDGSFLYVTSNSGFPPYTSTDVFFVIDTKSFQVVASFGLVEPFSPNTFFSNQRPAVRSFAAMRNGKLFYCGGIGTPHIFEYDWGTGVSHSPKPDLPTGFIRKSTNGARFVAYTDQGENAPELWVYDSDTDSFIAHSLMPHDNFPSAAANAAFNPEGTRILVNSHILLDQNLKQIADLWPGADYRNWVASAFSQDGSRVYAFGGPTFTGQRVVRVFDAVSGAVLGDVPAFDPPTWNPGIAVSAGGLAVVLSERGFALLDVTHPVTTLGATSPSFLLDSKVGLPESPAPTAFALLPTAAQAGAGYFFGNSSGKVVGSSTSPFLNGIMVQPPPVAQPGPVDVSVLFPDGWASFHPAGYSYGPVILFQDVDAGDSSGGTAVHLIGYGFDDPKGQPKVTIGGVSATVTGQFLAPGTNYPVPIEHLTLTTPPGPVGPADITLSTANGSVTKKNGFRYVSHAQIPGLYPLQMALDESRGLLYVVDAVSGDVQSVDVNTLSVSKLVSMAASPATSLAITPDHSKLLVVSIGARTLTVFDLSARKILRSLSFPAPAFPAPGDGTTTLIPKTAVGTARGTALVSLAIPNSTGGVVYEVDLQSGAASNLDPSQMLAGLFTARTLLAPSADGSIIYIKPYGGSYYPREGVLGGYVGVWRADLDAISYRKWFPTAYSVEEISTTASGDRLMVGPFSYSQNLDQLTAFVPNDLLMLLRNPVMGEKVNSTGSLVYVPTVKGVEIYDVHRGDMSLSIGIAGGLGGAPDGLVVDSTGSTLYIAETSGLGVMKLTQPPLSIGAVLSTGVPKARPVGGRRRSSRSAGTVTLLGSGFQQGATVRIGERVLQTNFISSTEIMFTPPFIAGGQVALRAITSPQVSERLSITVTNPNGDTYTLPAGLGPSTELTERPPSLTSVSTSQFQSSAPLILSVVGSGFVGSSQITLDDVPLQTGYVDTQHLSTYLFGIPAGQHRIAVSNPNGGTSNEQLLQIQKTLP